MTNLFTSIRQWLTVPQIAPGAYNYVAPAGYRLHLRYNPQGQSVVIVNASTVLHLNQTAAEYVYHLTQNHELSDVGRQVAARYNTTRTQAEIDYRNFVAHLERLIATPDLDPETYFEVERDDAYSAALSAPYRLDCALTYKVSAAAVDVAPVERVKRELSTEEWKTVLKKAWDVGIPHIIFTGGEPTLRPDLPDLVSHAQSLGQVTGLLTDGLRLVEAGYFEQLLQTGLDHLMILLDPQDERSWQAVTDAVAADIALSVHYTVTPANQANSTAVIERLVQCAVKKLSLSASDKNLLPTLQTLRDLAAQHGLALVWDIPVPYSAFNPAALELEEANQTPPTNAGKAWLYVEPDGDVLPAQGITRVLGNLLADPWEKIWQSAVK